LTGQMNNKTLSAPGAIGMGSTSSNYIGRSIFSRDNYLSGSVRNFRLYNHTLSANEVANIARGTGGGGGGGGGGGAAEDRVTSALVALQVPGLGDVQGNINLLTSVNGLQVTWTSDRPDTVFNNGRVVRPIGDDVVVELRAYIVYEGARGEQAFYAVVRGI
jgi:large repetitive protein